MNSIALVAEQAFEHHGAAVTPGARLSATPIEAAALTYQRKARFAQPSDRVTPPATPPAARSRQPRKTTAEREITARPRTPRKRRRDIQPAITK